MNFVGFYLVFLLHSIYGNVITSLMTIKDFTVGSLYSCTDLCTGNKSYYILTKKRSLDAEFKSIKNMDNVYYFNYDHMISEMQEFEYKWEKVS